MAMDYWDLTEMDIANMSMHEIEKRYLTPMFCSKCAGSHRTVDCGTKTWNKMREADENLSMEELFRRSIRAPLTCDKCGDPHNTMACTKRKIRTGEPNEDWSMKELEDYYSSSRIACEFCGDAHKSHMCQLREPQHFSWSNNGSYQNAHNPYVYKEELFGLSPPSPEIHNYFEEDAEDISREDFEELKESAKRIEMAVIQLAKQMECQPQESITSLREESPNELTIEIYTEEEGEEKIVDKVNEEEELVDEMSEEEELGEDFEVMKWVDPILPTVESNLNVLIMKEPLVELEEQEEKLIKVDFVVELLPEKYLRIKRQREIEFLLKIQDKDHTDKRSRKEEDISNGSKPSKKNRAIRESFGHQLEKKTGKMQKNDPDTIPFDPGG